jgi:uracil-DNA glycosylase family 4
MPAEPRAPGPECSLCPRLVAFREHWRDAEPDWHNAPVPSFGALDSRLLIVGLAPGLRGANRTGRPFTGDFAGDLLYATLLAFGFARGSYDRRADDGLSLADCRITNAVRCVPPANKPVGAEISACRPFLAAEIEAMPRLDTVLALGAVAHAAVLRTLAAPVSRFKFGHGVWHDLGNGGPALVDSYHCSRYNTNTGKLTEAMFGAVFDAIRRRLDAA